MTSDTTPDAPTAITLPPDVLAKIDKGAKRLNDILIEGHNNAAPEWWSVQDKFTAEFLQALVTELLQAEREACLAICLEEMHGSTFGEIKVAQRIEAKIKARSETLPPQGDFD